MTLTPFNLLASIKSVYLPLFSVVFTDWASAMATVESSGRPNWLAIALEPGHAFVAKLLVAAIS
jgi:hypothetical protein